MLREKCAWIKKSNLKKIFYTLLFLIVLAACNQQPVNNATAPAENKTTTINTSVFDLRRFENAVKRKISLDSIPGGHSDYLPAERQSRVLDSLTFLSAYQDPKAWYINPGETDNEDGVFYHGSVSRPSFNLVCFKTSAGDGGVWYDLITYSKGGKRIDLLEAASFPGETDLWMTSLESTLKSDTIRTVQTNCTQPDNAEQYFCDTIRTSYKLGDDGRFALLKSDTVYDLRLDSLRKSNSD